MTAAALRSKSSSMGPHAIQPKSPIRFCARVRDDWNRHCCGAWRRRSGSVDPDLAGGERGRSRLGNQEAVALATVAFPFTALILFLYVGLRGLGGS
jgi:hypothetical protein